MKFFLLCSHPIQKPRRGDIGVAHSASCGTGDIIKTRAPAGRHNYSREICCAAPPGLGMGCKSHTHCSRNGLRLSRPPRG